MRCPAIGLTGDAGVGKSRILSWLAAAGAACQDADALVRHLLASDEEVGREVAARFGVDVFPPGGALRPDRARLAARVFADPAGLADLEAILHPRVTAWLKRWLAGASDIRPAPAALAIEAVKLLEAGLDERLGLDQVWLIVCDGDLRRRRLAERGWSAVEAERRARQLAPLAWRLARADRVIDTSGRWEATLAQLAVAWQAITMVTRQDEDPPGGH